MFNCFFIYCSVLFRNILLKNGSAVDATIAAMFCKSVYTMQSMGLGGGLLMTIYIKENETAYTLNARETAPEKSAPDMFKGKPDASKHGKHDQQCLGVIKFKSGLFLQVH